ncbi:MAG: hypothetical protein LAO76_26750 [Acidobacteriia bacterium]|nr:hypothetical protein [Terriglobia bacterium]
MAAPDTIRQPQLLPAWPQWMDLKTLSRYACAGERTLREWIHRHNDPLPASQARGKIRVNRQTFDSWMERQSVKIERVDVDRLVDEIFSSVTGGK